MGTWGDAPWDSDVAADWFADVIEANRLGTEVEDTLHSDPVEHAEEIGAAAAILIMVARVYVWPIDDIDYPARQLGRFLVIAVHLGDWITGYNVVASRSRCSRMHCKRPFLIEGH